MSSNSTSIVNPIVNAADNIYQYWGDGIVDSKDTWDDYNINSGDGWSDTCQIEQGYSWKAYSDTPYQNWDLWGNSIRFIAEYWDDGNLINGDGCNSNWTIENGWSCSGGTSTSKDTCGEICGEGTRFNTIPTYWDDGNKISGDGWSSTWSIGNLNPGLYYLIFSCQQGFIETGWAWSGGTSKSRDYWSDIWGDGKKYTSLSTFWDDGNTVSGDGWSSVCIKETGWTWSGGSSTSKDMCTDNWGDGKKYTTLVSFWDDGNNISGDGCSSTWVIEFGWSWLGGTSLSKDTCIDIWGDGFKFNTTSTYCDDGNIINNDGWSSSWSVETGWSWSGGSKTNKDTWVEIWGDGTKFNSLATYWDDGNKINSDGCNSSCAVETGWKCVGGDSITKDGWTEIWGDGIRFNTLSSYWDNGNIINGDGWSSTCNIEVGWACSGGSTSTVDVWTEICGDGIKFNSIGTYCDDGNFFNNDGWNSSWGVEIGYQCIGGNSATKDSWVEIWGDGKRYNSVNTYWDDGNTLNGDGWSSLWFIENGWGWSGGSSSAKDVCKDTWGDGKKYNTTSTFWDDGNSISGDGCSSTCSVETGWTCSGGTISSPDTWAEICGDSKRFNLLSTKWDDGNLINGDGWSSIWSVELGYICSGGSSTNKDTWTEIWGDGIRFNLIASYWDDGNKANGDGWSSTCIKETGWSCSGGSTTTKDFWTEIWGDAKRFNTLVTYWDDGNLINGDGWSSSCSIESGWSCSGGTTSIKDTWYDIWGDGIKYGTLSTKCDDGNLINGDGWSTAWNVETGWTWSGGSLTSSDTWTEIWGDSKRFNTISTYWDDGNKINGDGWDSLWAIEIGWNWAGGSSTSKDIWVDIWGDGKKYSSSSTYWDDGNNVSNDGWSFAWLVETGWKWVGGTSINPDTWTEIWGDGKRFNTVSTYWDDGNLVNNDGWSSLCQVEAGQTWTGGNTSTKDTWKDYWGDGLKFSTASTYWDDGNRIGGDGWGSYWDIEVGWTCSGGSKTSKDSWSEIWGDGVRFNSESTYWDDGNNKNGDGWNSSWNVEVGFLCSGGSSIGKDVWEVWGDGVKSVLSSTYCDDGNIQNDDGWNSSWSIEIGWNCSGGSLSSKDTWVEIWGDGIKFNQNSAYCDDGNLNNGDGCSSNCSIENGFACLGGGSKTKDICDSWGDGKHSIASNLFWDDGNLVDSDGCSSKWNIESGWVWSGGTIISRDFWFEICGDGKKFNSYSSYWDDGNLINGDGCNSICGVESGYIWTGGNSTNKDMWSLSSNNTSSSSNSTSSDSTSSSSGEVAVSTQSASTAQTSTVVGIGGNFASSLLSMSSPASIFIMLNQFQMLLLLPLTGAYLSNQVVSVITGLRISL